MVVKRKKIYFGLDEINAFFGLDENAVGQVILKNSMREDMKDALETITWKGATWDETPIEKYQLFSHNLNTKANIWLFIMKKKLMPTMIAQSLWTRQCCFTT